MSNTFQPHFKSKEECNLFIEEEMRHLIITDDQFNHLLEEEMYWNGKNTLKVVKKGGVK